MTEDRAPSPRRADTDTAGVLLAAGVGSRFAAGNKLLTALDGTSVVRRAAAALCAAHVDPVLVVVGHEADRVRDALVGLDVHVVDNPDYEEGQATSVAAALDALGTLDASGDTIDYVVFALGDMPSVRPDTVDRLVSVAHESEAGIVVPTYDGTRGNPVVFHRRYFSALAAVDGDRGGRALFETEPVTRTPIDDPGVCVDVDTVADLDALAGE